jgi:hypothetical protein
MSTPSQNPRPSPADIDVQRELLATHRRTLALYLKQQAIHGVENTPPGVQHGINQARSEIKRIKMILRSWNVVIDDEPNDDEPIPSPFEPISRESNILIATLTIILIIEACVILPGFYTGGRAWIIPICLFPIYIIVALWGFVRAFQLNNKKIMKLSIIAGIIAIAPFFLIFLGRYIAYDIAR